MAADILRDLNGDMEMFDEVMMQLMMDIGKDLMKSEQVEIQSEVLSSN
jgi:hypothetical protein